MGGAETLVKDYALGLDKSKFNVVILCSIKWGAPYEKVLENAGIRVAYINDYSFDKPKTVFGKFIIQQKRFHFVKNFFIKEKPDVIHVHLGLLQYIQFANPKCKIFYTVHNTPDWVWGKSKKEEKAAMWLLKNRDFHFIVLHEEMKKQVDARFRTERSLVLNNGIDFTHFDISINKNAVRKKIGIPENAFVVGHIGRFINQKNHFYLVDIFSEIIKKNRNAFLLMIGDGELKENVSKRLDALGLKNHYLILSNRTDIPKLMRIMNIFIFPSFFEGLPVVLMESQKSELKSIVSNNITKSVKISNLLKFKSISDSAVSWAEEALSFDVPEIKYYGIENWDMKNVIKKLEQLYEDAVYKEDLSENE